MTPSERSYSAGQSATSTGIALDQMPGACRWCSTGPSATFHNGPCPRVKAIEYHGDGTVKRVEFHDGSSS